MNYDKIIITKKKLKGLDGYKTFSVRIKDDTVEALDQISVESNRSRNELINIFLDFCVHHYEIISQESPAQK